MEVKKKLRCPIAAPGAMIAALIGLVMTIINITKGDWINALVAFGLMMIAMPFIRIVFMVHSTNDRLDEIEQKLNK